MWGACLVGKGRAWGGHETPAKGKHVARTCVRGRLLDVFWTAHLAHSPIVDSPSIGISALLKADTHTTTTQLLTRLVARHQSRLVVGGDPHWSTHRPILYLAGGTSGGRGIGSAGPLFPRGAALRFTERTGPPHITRKQAEPGSAPRLGAKPGSSG